MAAKRARPQGRGAERARGRGSGAERARAQGRPGRRPPAAAGGGFTLVEVLVAVAVLAVVSVPLAGILGGGWRTQAQAAARAVLQEEAARALRTVARGSAGGGRRTAGLVHAVSACASPDSLCADGLVVLAMEPEINQVVSFYVEGGSLVRRVCHLNPAAGCPADRLVRGAGAATLLGGVTSFTVERIASDPDLYRLSLTVKGGPAAGAPFTLVTVAGPRDTTF